MIGTDNDRHLPLKINWLQSRDPCTVRARVRGGKWCAMLAIASGLALRPSTIAWMSSGLKAEVTLPGCRVESSAICDPNFD